MTLDHAAVVMLEESFWYLPMRAAGRIAFVIFAFLMAQSIEKTTSAKRFCIRLLAFALISEPLFDLTFYGSAFYPAHQNIFFTLLSGVLAVLIYKKSGKNGSLAVSIAVLAPQLLGFDYGGIGVMLIFAFWLLGRRNLSHIILVFAAVSALGAAWINIFCLAAIPLLSLYNGKRGGDGYPILRKYFFYFYYPAHIAVIGFIHSAAGRL